MYNLYYNILHIGYVITADGFPPGGSGPYTYTQKAKDCNIQGQPKKMYTHFNERKLYVV